MSLRSKIVLILIAVVGVYAVATDRIQRAVFFDKFEEVEILEAKEDIGRLVKALHQEIDAVYELSQSWSMWDDSYAFLGGERVEAFERSNLQPETLSRQGIDLLFFLSHSEDENAGRRVVWHTIIDPEDGRALRLRDFPTGEFQSRHPLLVKDDAWRERMRAERRRDQGVGEHRPDRPAGILLTEHGPLLVSALPVHDSRAQGPQRGTVILGRFLGRNLDAELTRLTSVDFDFWQLDGRSELPAEVARLLDQVTSVTGPVIDESDESDGLLRVYRTFPDFWSRPELLLRANVSRDITAVGRTAVNFGLVSALAGSFVLLLVLMTLLERIVLAPLTKLTRHAIEIGRKENFKAKLAMDRSDELGALSVEFDDMMSKLEGARAALVDTARAAGMSEIATGILHNVGNVLNSVNVSTALVTRKVEEMSVTDLKQVVGILQEHEDDLAAFIEEDPQGKHLQPFLTALSSQLCEERSSIAAEMSSLSQGVEHICDLIKSQQSYAVKTDMKEEVSLAARLDEALTITEQALTLDPRLEVVREYEELPEVLVDKHRLLEVLINLIRNALQSMDDAGGAKRLSLRVARDGDDHVLLEVGDTGLGIASDALIQVFQMGYTTKASGHGYGLHTAANAATELCGSLAAHSDGEGRGARFTLRLPLEIPITA
ncbi:MAG: CHASE4 domain-containing protein [Planctomycetota bacterium]